MAGLQETLGALATPICTDMRHLKRNLDQSKGELRRPARRWLARR